MSAMDKVNNILGKLPFVKLAGNIPESIRGKIPFLNVLIPFANHIASGAAIVVLVACFGGGGGGGVASSKDFSYELINDAYKHMYAGPGWYDGIFSSDGIAITSYSGNGGKVIIPATIEGYPVRLIHQYAFQGSKWVESAGKTFYYPPSRITEVVIPENVEIIGSWAFENCENLKTLTLPASLKVIGAFAFADCPELENLNIPASASFKIIFGGAFNESHKLPLKIRQQLEALGEE